MRIATATAAALAAFLASAETLTQNDAEFFLSGKVPRAVEGIALPPERTFSSAKADCAKMESRLASLIAAKPRSTPLKTLVKDRDFCRNAMALDAIRRAGAANLDALAAKAPKYAAFIRTFLSDPDFLRLYASAGLVPSDTAEGFRVMADIWARDGQSPDFDKRLAAGIAACWGAGPQSDRLQYCETLGTDDGDRCDPVWRYFFFRDGEKKGLLHPGYKNLKPWEIRFIAGNSWSDESLWYLRHRINLPWDGYDEACNAVRYAGYSPFGATVQGALYWVQAPAWMGAAQKAVVHGGVCGALSHTGAHAAAAHGIPAYTVGQPGHCAYAYRPERGKWIGGNAGPDGNPHNWIFPGVAPTMTRLMERAFGDDKLVDRCVLLLALWRLKVPGAGAYLAKAWPHNAHVQEEFLKNLKATGGKVSEHFEKILLPAYAEHGFALYRLSQPFEDDIVRELGREGLAKWRLSVHGAIAGTPPSWAAKDTGKIVEEQIAGMGEAAETAYVGKLFGVYAGAKNDQAFGGLLEWAIERYVKSGREATFGRLFEYASEGLKAAAAKAQAKAKATKGAPADSSAGGDADSARKAFGGAIIAAENARSPIAVNALTDLAEKKGLSDGWDPGKKIKMPSGERLVSDRGFLTISTTSVWDRPVDHRNVLRDAPGRFHTDREPLNWAIVDLGSERSVGTVIIVKNSGWESRSKHMRILRSVDGATFLPVAESEDTPSEWRVQCGGQRARWIKVERISAAGDYFHLRNILVFEKGR